MVVVSLFTKKVPYDELGGLTWRTINDPPIGRAKKAIEQQSVDIETATTNGTVVSSDAIEMMEASNGKGIQCQCVLFHNSVTFSSCIILQFLQLYLFVCLCATLFGNKDGNLSIHYSGVSS